MWISPNSLKSVDWQSEKNPPLSAGLLRWWPRLFFFLPKLKPWEKESNELLNIIVKIFYTNKSMIKYLFIVIIDVSRGTFASSSVSVKIPALITLGAVAVRRIKVFTLTADRMAVSVLIFPIPVPTFGTPFRLCVFIQAFSILKSITWIALGAISPFIPIFALVIDGNTLIINHDPSLTAYLTILFVIVPIHASFAPLSSMRKKCSDFGCWYESWTTDEPQNDQDIEDFCHIFNIGKSLNQIFL